MPSSVVKYVQQSLTELQQNQVFTNLGLNGFARLNYTEVLPPTITGRINVTYPSGATCTISNGTTTYTAPDTSGSWECDVNAFGIWTVTAVGVVTATASVNLISGAPSKSVALYFGQVTVTYPAGATCTITDGTTTYTAPDTTGSWTCDVNAIGEWTATAVGDVTVSESVTLTSTSLSGSIVIYFGQINVTYPSGAICTMTQGSVSYTAPDTTGSWSKKVFSLGAWTVTITGTVTNSGTVTLTSAAPTQSITLQYRTSYPLFSFKYGSTTYTFTNSSTTGSVSGVYYFWKSGNNWEFYALKSGTITVATNVYMNVDVYLQGGGYNGGNGSGNCSITWGGSQIYYYEGTSASGGAGGLGGYRKTVTNQTLNGSYSVTVGAAAAHSLLGSLTSSGGTTVAASGAGTYSFGDSSAKGPDGNSRRVGAGGGVGGWIFHPNGGSGSAGSGGSYGGGNGGSANVGSANAGSNATFYGSGGGGGGGWARSERKSSYSSYDESVIDSRCGSAAGGSGYQGFVAMRNKR